MHLTAGNKLGSIFLFYLKARSLPKFQNMIQMNLLIFTKQKKTFRHRKQNSLSKGKGGDGRRITKKRKILRLAEFKKLSNIIVTQSMTTKLNNYWMKTFFLNIYVFILNKGFSNQLVIQSLDFFSRMKWQPTLVFLPGKSHEAWWAAVHGVAVHGVAESDTT